MHLEAYEGFARMLAQSGLDPNEAWYVLDVGGAAVNGSVHDQIPKSFVTGLDIAPAPGVAIVADASHPGWLYEHGRAFDVVISTELFEHAESWRKIIANMADALSEDGPQVLIATCASTGRPPHGSRGEWGVPAGQFYGNVAPQDLQFELDRYFTEVLVEYNPNPGDAYCYAKGLRP